MGVRWANARPVREVSEIKTEGRKEGEFMRSKKVNRYYCDHCSKGMFRKPDMLRHEIRCTKNPKRSCGLCETENTPVMERVKKVKELGDNAESLKWLMNDCGNCPPCVLAVIQQLYIETDELWFATGYDSETGKPRGLMFDYKKEMEAWWHDKNQIHSGAYQPIGVYP
jgi:hypothetical protein